MTEIERPPSSSPSPSEFDTSAKRPSGVTARPTGPKPPVGMTAAMAFIVPWLPGSSALVRSSTVTVPTWPCWKAAAAASVALPEWFTT